MPDDTTTTATEYHGTFERWFALIITLCAFAYIAGITFIQIPQENIRIVDTALGFILGTMLPPLLNWAFRTSIAATRQKAMDAASRERALIEAARIRAAQKG